MKCRHGFLIVALLTGCSTTPTTYLMLAPVGGATHRSAGPPITVARVAMPASIDRLYLTSATGPNTISVARHTRWVAPLGGQAQSVLATDLAMRLPGTTIVRPGDAAPAGGARLVSVNVTRFMPRPGQVVLDADWQIVARHHHRVIAKGRANIVIPTSATPAAQAASMSLAIGQVSDAIAANLSR